MICPGGIASEVCALRGVKVGDHAQHDLLGEGRDGEGDESTGSDLAGHGQEDYVAAGSGNYRHQRPADVAWSTLPAPRINRAETCNWTCSFVTRGSFEMLLSCEYGMEPAA
jgi:hypothetical protein